MPKLKEKAPRYVSAIVPFEIYDRFKALMNKGTVAPYIFECGVLKVEADIRAAKELRDKKRAEKLSNKI